ncbi:MAG: hypothetical protein H0W82_02280 [Actinobacteria bacterium]|nr:hypothetical protein [Actinomycetota bacterium]
MPFTTSDHDVPWADWETWRAAQSGMGVFEVVEIPDTTCGACQGQGTRYYPDAPLVQHEDGSWTVGRLGEPMPCPDCFGTRITEGSVMVRLVERRRLPK